MISIGQSDEPIKYLVAGAILDSTRKVKKVRKYGKILPEVAGLFLIGSRISPSSRKLELYFVL